MQGYGSFCPVAKAVEILSERWILLVLRNIRLGGARRFNEILGGVPRMSPTLLTKHLRELREMAGHGGQSWVRSMLPGRELDPGELMSSPRQLRPTAAEGRIDLQRSTALIRSMPNWFARSKFADDTPINPD